MPKVVGAEAGGALETETEKKEEIENITPNNANMFTIVPKPSTSATSALAALLGSAKCDPATTVRGTL